MIRHYSILIIAGLSAIQSTSALAEAKTYTPAQLKAMVNSGKFPPQNNPREIIDTAPFPACKASLRSTIRGIQENYPVRKLIDNNTTLSMKAWINDGAVVMSCSSDGKFVTQFSSYK